MKRPEMLKHTTNKTRWPVRHLHNVIKCNIYAPDNSVFKKSEQIDTILLPLYFREAIALAKVRLSPLDPVLFDLYSTWARKLETDSSFEQAAKW